MKMRIVFSFLLSYSLVVAPVYAANPPTPAEADPTELRVEVTITDPAKVSRAEQLKQMLEEAHESIEGEEEGSFLTKWINQFNYKRMVLSAYRWYEVKRSDPKTADAALNLVMMLAASHTLETIGGTSLAGAGLAPDTSWWARILFTVVGVGITLPGLDPLCLGLMALYFRYPQTVDATLQAPRVVIFKSTSFLARYSGISAVMRWMWETKDARAWLQEKIDKAVPGTYVYEATVDGYTFSMPAKDGGRSPLILKLIPKQEGLGLAEIELDKAALTKQGLGRDASQWLQLFGWNLSDAVIESAALIAKREDEKLAKRIYFGSIKDHGEFVELHYKSDALRLHPQRNLRPWRWATRQAKNCFAALAQPYEDHPEYFQPPFWPWM